MRALHVVNASQNHTVQVNQNMPMILDALNLQLHHLAAAWGEYVYHLYAAPSDRGFAMVFADDDQQVQGALAYHDVLANGTPYAMILLDEILGNGGTWLEGDVSVSGAASHELCELLGDPGANRWANDAQGEFWALELCDATQGDSYVLNGVAVSNFLLPAYFNPLNADGPYDYLGVVNAPFEIRPNGYAISGSRGAVFGDEYPSWRKEYATRPGARTRARLGWASH
jgi:hypothetical protein